jgi:hypothetical protein
MPRLVAGGFMHAGGFRMIRTIAIVSVVAFGVGLGSGAGPVQSQERSRLDCDDRDWHNDRAETHCVIVERNLRPGSGAVRVDAHPNGGVTVVGWDRNEIRLRVKVKATAGSRARAEELVRGVEIRTGGNDIRADGPDTERRESWYATFELQVPRTSDLWVRARNGGIDVADVRGDIDLSTQNGGLHLRSLGGNVRGHTTNGGVDVMLDGRRWDGEGLDVRTTNGGVKLTVPRGYSAELETGTVNGGLDIEFPVQVRGRVTRRLTTTLGDGGPPIRVVTTNGGVSVRER